MQDIYLIILVVLFALAITDLIVGVSNDAVNFLNSAVGSHVAPRHVIMIVASLGIFIGATFSSGIMEVARSGIFFPDQFYFSDVMIIFVAVMITDIILLDLFNTFGLPTSTTVSIVFELLGASFVIALLKIWNEDHPLDMLPRFINSERALTIISGIFLSIFIAFTIGVLVQYISRALFTFEYKRKIKSIGVLWSGVSLAALTYFLFVKGIKGASFVTDETIDWFQSNSLIILLLSFVSWSVILFIVYNFTKFNVLKIIVLFGTFALAMAFAGNDLVNFIGVPIAGLESFRAWSMSGIGPESLLMDSLNAPVKTNTYLLLLAGLVMVLTLWFSKKARTVTETEVNLARQSAGLERFGSNIVSRGIVRGAWGLGKGISTLLPQKVLDALEHRFRNNNIHTKNSPAFDLIRASVNLTVASILIAFATSLKLPLSTTYVSFMVAMGTSLSDRAWGRDSAVYRVSGVINVILGWFSTALIAFTVSGLFAFLIYYFGLYVIGILLVVAILLIIRSFTYHRSIEEEKSSSSSLLDEQENVPIDQAHDEIKTRTYKNLKIVRDLYVISIEALTNEREDPLKDANKKLSKLSKKSEVLKSNLLNYLHKIQESNPKACQLYLSVYGIEQDMNQSIDFIINNSLNHVQNMHSPLNKDQVRQLNELMQHVTDLFEELRMLFEKPNGETVSKKRKRMTQRLDQMISEVIHSSKASSKTSELFFNLLLETKDLIASVSRLTEIFSEEREIKKAVSDV